MKRKGEASSSGSNWDTFNFKSAENYEAFLKYSKVPLNVARPLDPSQDYGCPIYGLFEGTGLEDLLTMKLDFHSDLVYIWFSNLGTAQHSSLRSYTFGQDVEITVDDFATYLNVPNDGPSLWPLFRSNPDFNWSPINQTLTKVEGVVFHDCDVNHLHRDAYLVQHVLRNNIFPKAGDRIHITPILSLATYYCLTKTKFNVAEAFLHLISRLTCIRKNKKIINISFGHIIEHIICQKYGIRPNKPPDKYLIFFKKKGFNMILKRFRPNGDPILAGEGDDDEDDDHHGNDDDDRHGNEDDRHVNDVDDIKYVPPPPAQHDNTSSQTYVTRTEFDELRRQMNNMEITMNHRFDELHARFVNFKASFQSSFQLFFSSWEDFHQGGGGVGPSGGA